MSVAAQWFAAQLHESDCASVKLRYVEWHAEDRGVPFAQDDPLQCVAAGEAGWTVAALLWRTRLVALDERTLWECIASDMVATRLQTAVDPWNEQLAVKLAFRFVEAQGGCTPPDAAESASLTALRAELDAYAAVTIKPQGSATVECGASSSAAQTDSWSDRVAFIPMAADNDFSEGSLCCTGPVPSCGTLLRVPRTEMFFRETVMQHCALGRALDTDPALEALSTSEEAVLVLCLVYERFIVGVEHSHWRRLLTHCPARYPTVPTTWELCDLTVLDGLDMLDDILAKRAQLQTFATQLEEALLPLLHRALASASGDADAVPSLEALAGAFTWERLAWAQSTFDSRAFNLNVDGAVVMALVPLADMINHGNRTDVLVRKVEADGGPFTMQVGAALTAADVGRELWMSYGPLQNWELLQHYGFVLSTDNTHDKLPFPIALPEASATATVADAALDEDAGWEERRRALMRRYALGLPGRCWVPHSGTPPAALLALLRVQLAQAEEFDVMERRRWGPFGALSTETEAAVVAVVASTVQSILDSFPTTLAEDEEALAEVDSDRAASSGKGALDDGEDEDGEEAEDVGALTNYVLCLRLRVALKRIGARCLDWCARHRSGGVETDVA